jgi:hypothetical protein
MNCVVYALAQKLRHPFRVKLKRMRNRKGRWHWYWQKDGVNYEYYAKGRSQYGYLRNLCYSGKVRQFTCKL